MEQKAKTGDPRLLFRKTGRLSEEPHVQPRDQASGSAKLDLPSSRGGRAIRPISRKSSSYHKSRPSRDHSYSGRPLARSVEESEVLELVRARVAQIHQCPELLAWHLSNLEASGDGPRPRFHELETWHTSHLFTDPERAALALCDRITRVAEEPFPDSLFQDMHRYFTNDGIVGVTLAILAAVDWNFPHSLHDEIDRSKA